MTVIVCRSVANNSTRRNDGSWHRQRKVAVVHKGRAGIFMTYESAAAVLNSNCRAISESRGLTFTDIPF